MLRLATYYTPSHREMCERFVLSRAAGFSDVIAREYPQKCPSGSFKQDGWNACMDDKLDLLMRLPMDGTPTLYVDSDVILLPGLAAFVEERVRVMQFNDLHYSDDVVQWCAGVMLFRSTNKLYQWWRLVADLSQVWDLPDQDVIHQLRQQAAARNGRLPVPMATLPQESVANWATIGNRDVWSGQQFTVPDSCVAWHANWTIGVEMKMQMLSMVAETYASRQTEAVAS